MPGPRILAIVMAGGEGKRLHPLTSERSKPSVPFGGRNRIVDFVLSSLINSEIYAIYLLVQYKSQSLIEHVRRAWSRSPITPGHFVTVVPPQMRVGQGWFQGTADAVYQNLNLILDHGPDLVAVFGADHIYRMDLRQMVAFHRESRADVSVAALPVPRSEARAFGIIATDEDGRIREFQEKPQNPAPMPGRPECAYASMGNYLFNTEVLVSALREGHERDEHDFGKNVLPRLAASHRVHAYDFSANTIPGTKEYEEPAYWRDVGTIEAYFAAHKDVLGLQPRFDAFNPQWPIYSSNYQGPVAKIISGNIVNSILGAGSIVNGAAVRNSVIRREVYLEEDVEIEDSILMDYVRIGRGSRLRRVIVDRYNTIAAATSIGFDPTRDRSTYHVTESGIIVVPRGQFGAEPVY
jgi:glucose-1-phosphate adenylyltransferase